MARKSSESKGPTGSRPGEVQEPGTVQIKFTVDRETAKALKLEAFGRDCSIGHVVEELVKSSPRRFVLMEQGKGSDGGEV